MTSCDWQTTKQKLSERGQYLLESGLWSDCNFIVGPETQQQTLKGHKLFLAMSSPVFEAMFFGGMAEKNDPIMIKDVQPEAFKALLEYIYTDKVELGSFELACELCYCAKKYMLPSLVEECTKYLWSDLSPKKACRAYEFAKLFEEPILLDKCLQIIRTKTSEVLKESSWEEVELKTVLKVLDQDDLQIASEMELFFAVERWAQAECRRKSLDHTDGKSLKSVIGDALLKIRFLSLAAQEFAQKISTSPLLTQSESYAIVMNILCSESKTPMPEGFSINRNGRTKPLQIQATNFSLFGSTRRINLGDDTLYNIYRSDSLNTAMDCTTSSFKTLDGGAGGIKEIANLPSSSSGMVVREERKKYYCHRSVAQKTDCLNTNVLDCSVQFKADTNICVVGVQVPTQVPAASTFAQDADTSYTEILYAHLLDCDGTRLTYTHFTTKAYYDSLVEITFNRPVYIQKHKVYRVGVVFNKAGWYPLGVCAQNARCNSVYFSFGGGDSDAHAGRDGLIRSIIFTYH